MWRKQYGSAMPGKIRFKKVTQAYVEMMIIWTRGERVDKVEKVVGGKSHSAYDWLWGVKGECCQASLLLDLCLTVKMPFTVVGSCGGHLAWGEGGDPEFSFGCAECELPSRYLKVLMLSRQ